VRTVEEIFQEMQANKEEERYVFVPLPQPQHTLNGQPWQFFPEETKWHKRYLELAKHISTWSKDPSTQVGAVVVTESGREYVGYNGFPHGIADTEARLTDREKKYKLTIHAEKNALRKAGMDECRGGKIYILLYSNRTSSLLQSMRIGDSIL
jgi:deoxycytidylate deaminase